jgi:WD40 repeat protein
MKNVLLFILLLGTAAFAQNQTQTQTQPQSQPAAPPGTDMFLFHLKHGKIAVADMRNITQRKGYDNQPQFLTNSKQLYYTSIREDGQADIFLYDIENSKTKQLTDTPESEFSPTQTPDGKFISTVRVEKDGTQRLWKFPVDGGAPVLILQNIKPVGYHSWINANSVALFILGEPATLQLAEIDSGKVAVIATNIGRSIRKVPGKKSVSFVQRLTETTGTIEEYDPETKQTSAIVKLFPETEDYAWSPNGTLWTSKGAVLYSFQPGKDQDWVQAADLSASGLKQVTRIAISPDENWIAVVSAE